MDVVGYHGPLRSQTKLLAIQSVNNLLLSFNSLFCRRWHLPTSVLLSIATLVMLYVMPGVKVLISDEHFEWFVIILFPKLNSKGHLSLSPPRSVGRSEEIAIHTQCPNNTKSVTTHSVLISFTNFRSSALSSGSSFSWASWVFTLPSFLEASTV